MLVGVPVDVWAAFVAATIVLLAVPGPTVALVVGYAAAGGRRTAWAAVPGVVLGDFIAMTVSLAGAGAVLAASAGLFTVLKLIGAGYLVWLGLQRWRMALHAGRGAVTRPDAVQAGPGRGDHRRRIFWNCALVTALNPKSITFFVAFVPQFVDPSRGVAGQFVVLEATFLVLAGMSIATYAVAVGALRSRAVGNGGMSRAARAGNWLAGGFLIGAGLMTAVARRGG